jgi:DNA repair exonuclease SbcCD ATPase subunit
MASGDKIKRFPWHSENQGEGRPGENPEQIVKEARKDMGKVALIVSVLVLVLMVVFFYSLRQNIASVSDNVVVSSEEVAELSDQVAKMQDRMSSLTGVSQDVNGLEKTLSSVRDKMGRLEGKMDERIGRLAGKMDERMGQMEKQLSRVEEIPQRTRDMMYAAMLKELSQKVEFLSGQMKGAQKENLLQVNKMLQQIQKSAQ